MIFPYFNRGPIDIPLNVSSKSFCFGPHSPLLYFDPPSLAFDYSRPSSWLLSWRVDAFLVKKVPSPDPLQLTPQIFFFFYLYCKPTLFFDFSPLLTFSFHGRFQTPSFKPLLPFFEGLTYSYPLVRRKGSVRDKTPPLHGLRRGSLWLCESFFATPDQPWRRRTPGVSSPLGPDSFTTDRIPTWPAVFFFQTAKPSPPAPQSTSPHFCVDLFFDGTSILWVLIVSFSSWFPMLLF